MKLSRLWTAAGIIGVVILVMFVLSVPRVSEVQTSVNESVPSIITPVVKISDVYKKGSHTIKGSIVTKDACTTVEVTAAGNNGNASSTEILLAIKTLETSGVCLQIPTAIQFVTTVNAPSNLPITVTVNDTLASTTDL